MTIKGLIFDCDGTLADTMPLHWLAWNQITTRHGILFPEDRFYSLGGVPSRDILAMLRDERLPLRPRVRCMPAVSAWCARAKATATRPDLHARSWGPRA